MDELLGQPRGPPDGLEVAEALYRERGDGFARLGYAVGYPLRPVRLYANNDHGGDVRVGAGPDNGPEVECQIFAVLEPPVGVGQGHGALYVVRHGLARRVRDVVNGQDYHVVSDPDPTV